MKHVIAVFMVGLVLLRSLIHRRARRFVRSEAIRLIAELEGVVS